MKYTALFGLAALALGFSACDEIEDATGLPQTNPQLPILTVDNVPVTPNAATAQGINLAQINEAGGTIQLAEIQTPSDFPEGFRAEVLWIEIGNDAAFTKTAAIQAETDAEGNVTVQADDWQTAQVDVFGKNPKTTTTYVRIPAWAVNGKQEIRLKDKDAYFSEFNTQVTPIDLFDGHVIEDTYYLVGSFCDWDFSKAIKFEHNDDYSPYDDPTFTVTVPGQTKEWEWIIIPESTHAAGQFVDGPESSYGVEFANKTSGDLVTNDTQDYGTPGKISILNASVAIRVDMEKLTYEAVPLVLYTPGVANGWSDLTATQALQTSDLKTYTGFAHLNGDFKFANPSTWYGAGEGAGKLSTAPDAGNLNVDRDGLYWCSANIDAMSYSVTHIDRFCIVGDASPAGWNPAADDATAVKLTPSADYLIWTAVVTLKDGGLKFNANTSWDIQLGMVDGELANNGGSQNIPGPGAGKYLVTLDLSGRPYTCTFTPQP